MVRLKMSQNQVIEMTRILKEDVAVKFEEYYTTKLSKKSHTLDDFFEAREVQLFSKGAHESEDDNGSTELALEKTTGIFCHNLPGLINHVVRERNIKEPFYKYQVSSIILFGNNLDTNKHIEVRLAGPTLQ